MKKAMTICMGMGIIVSLVGFSAIANADTAEKVVDTIAAMKALNTGTYQHATVLGFTTKGDSGGGQFYYDLSSSEPDDYGTVFSPDVGGGRWLRRIEGPINIVMFGAILNDTGDDRTSINAAINYVKNKGGGVVVHPKGDARVSAEVQIPDYIRYVGECRDASRLIPTANNMYVVHIYGSYVGFENVTVANALSQTGVNGIRISPLNETQTTTLTNTNFNTLRSFAVKGCTEGVVLRPGPDVGGTDSGCWYNSFIDFQILNCTRGILLDEGPNADHSGVNRNNFIAGRIGAWGGPANTGLQIKAGDTNNFVSVHFEGIASGTSPNTTPTAVKVHLAGPTYNVESHHNKFLFCEFEACTRNVENDHHDTEFWGCWGIGSSITGISAPRILAGGLVFDIRTTVKTSMLQVVDTASIDLNNGTSPTRHSIISGGSGGSSNYNGLYLASNEKTDGSQGNNTLPSMAIDIGGRDNISYPGTSNTVTFFNRPAGGASSQIFQVKNNGVVNVSGGISNNGGGFKHARVSTGSLGSGATATVTVNWGTAFPDTNYTVTASVVEATSTTSTLRVHHIQSVTAGSVAVVIKNDGTIARTGTLHVIAVHD